MRCVSDEPRSAHLVAQISGGKALPNEVVAQIAERTDGVPLFVEEVTKSILESGLLREEADRYVIVGLIGGPGSDFIRFAREEAACQAELSSVAFGVARYHDARYRWPN
jgi:hypothetical protein